MIIEMFLVAGVIGYLKTSRRKSVSSPEHESDESHYGAECDEESARTSANIAEDSLEDSISEEEAALQRRRRSSWLLLTGTVTGKLVNPVFTMICVPFLLYRTAPLIRAAYLELNGQKKPGGASMRALTSSSVLASGSFGISALTHVLFAEADKLRFKVERTSRDRLKNVFGELPRTVLVRRAGLDLELPLHSLAKNDVVIVRAGQVIPVDGIIVCGVASVDQQALTGEAQPAEKGVGEPVFAATIVLSGAIDIRVDSAGADTLVANIEDILSGTADYTSNLELKSNQVADRSVVPVLGLTAVTYPLLGSEAAIAILATYPGEGMRIIGPLSLLNFVRQAAEERILVKDGRALESLQDIDTVVFDKTGTLTHSVPEVTTVHALGSKSKNMILCYAAAAERDQSHPIALAIKKAAADLNLPHPVLPTVDDTSYDIGLGISVKIDGFQVRLGSARYMGQFDLQPGPTFQDLESESREDGNSFVYLAIGSEISGAIELKPALRPEAKTLIAGLHARGIEVYILSGDHERPTARLAEELGADCYRAGALPGQKADLIQKWQEEGRKICFVGDGINDSIALKTAHVSVSLSGASTIASDTAQIVFMDPSLEKLLPLLELTDDLENNMKNNMVALLAPSPILLTGVYLFRFRLMSATFLLASFLVLGLFNATSGANRAGRIRNQKRSKKIDPPEPINLTQNGDEYGEKDE